MLNQAYTIQVVSRPETPSGVWRYPVNSRTARNYYLIVEAISPSGAAPQPADHLGGGWFRPYGQPVGLAGRSAGLRTRQTGQDG